MVVIFLPYFVVFRHFGCAVLGVLLSNGTVLYVARIVIWDVWSWITGSAWLEAVLWSDGRWCWWRRISKSHECTRDFCYLCLGAGSSWRSQRIATLFSTAGHTSLFVAQGRALLITLRRSSLPKLTLVSLFPDTITKPPFGGLLLCLGAGSNCWPFELQSNALPTELPKQVSHHKKVYLFMTANAAWARFPFPSKRSEVPNRAVVCSLGIFFPKQAISHNHLALGTGYSTQIWENYNPIFT